MMLNAGRSEAIEKQFLPLARKPAHEARNTGKIFLPVHLQNDPALKGKATKCPVTKCPALKSPEYKRFPDQRSGTLKALLPGPGTPGPVQPKKLGRWRKIWLQAGHPPPPNHVKKCSKNLYMKIMGPIFANYC